MRVKTRGVSSNTVKAKSKKAPTRSKNTGVRHERAGTKAHKLGHTINWQSDNNQGVAESSKGKRTKRKSEVRRDIRGRESSK